MGAALFSFIFTGLVGSRLFQRRGSPAPAAAFAPASSPGRDLDSAAAAARSSLKERLEGPERKIILDELQKTEHNRPRAAKNPRLSANTL